MLDVCWIERCIKSLNGCQIKKTMRLVLLAIPQGLAAMVGTSMAMDHRFGTHAITIIRGIIRVIRSEINLLLGIRTLLCGYQL